MLEFEKYIILLNKSKIFVGSGNNLLSDTVSIKYLETMASGTLFITSKPINLEEYEFVEGKHLIIYNNFDDLKEKIFYYLEHETERMEITKNAMEHVSNNFTNEKVIQKMLEDIEWKKNFY